MVVVIRTVLVLLLFAVAACGNGSTPRTGTSNTRPPAHNANDEGFLRLEVAHHDQAIEMAEIALQKSRTAGILRYARQIKQVQTAQVATMLDHLKAWGAVNDNHGHTHEPPGNLSSHDMRLMRTVTGAEFDRYWTQMMVLHEIEAGDLAATEDQYGLNSDVKSLAKELNRAQGKLTDDLLRILKRLPKA